MQGVWCCGVALLSALAFAAPPLQIPVKSEDGRLQDATVTKRRPLHGRFLHITGPVLMSIFPQCKVLIPV